MKEIDDCFNICQEKGLPARLVINAYLNAKYDGGEKKPDEINGAMIIEAFHDLVNKYNKYIKRINKFGDYI